MSKYKSATEKAGKKRVIKSNNGTNRVGKTDTTVEKDSKLLISPQH